MWTPKDAARYMRNYLDVFKAWLRSDKRLGPTLFAQRHYEKEGKAKGYKTGEELAPHRDPKPPAYVPPKADPNEAPVTTAMRILKTNYDVLPAWNLWYLYDKVQAHTYFNDWVDFVVHNADYKAGDPILDKDGAPVELSPQVKLPR